MLSFLQRIPLLPLMLLILTLNGCVAVAVTMPTKTPAHVVPQIIITSPQDIARLITEKSSEVRTIEASGHITIKTREGETLHAPMILKYKAPDRLYIRAYQTLVPNVFTAINCGNAFWLFIPDDNVIYTGTVEALRANPDIDVTLTPDVLLKGLISPAPPYDAQYTMQPVAQGYTLSIVEQRAGLARLLRTVTVEGPTFNCVHEQFFSEKGLVIAEVTREVFEYGEGVVWPLAHRVTMHAKNGTIITLTLKNINANKDMTDETFAFSFPKGVDVEHITAQ